MSNIIRMLKACVAVFLTEAKPGADPGFFSGGGAPLRNDVTDSELKNF